MLSNRRPRDFTLFFAIVALGCHPCSSARQRDAKVAGFASGDRSFKQHYIPHAPGQRILSETGTHNYGNAKRAE